MSDEQLTPLDPDIADLIAGARSHDDMPEAMRVRLRSRLGLPAGIVPPGSPASPAAPSAMPSLAHALLKHPLRNALLAFAVGGGVGAGIHARLSRPPAPRTIVVERVVHVPAPVVVAPAPVVPSPALPTPVPPIADSPDVTEAPHVPAAHPGEPLSGDTSLRAEQRVLEMARTALTRGQYGAALEALGNDARRFPHGQLAEERDSLTVQALIGAGRFDDARAHAARFAREHPGSLLGPAVEAAIRTIP